MLFAPKKKQPENREKSFEEMSNLEIFECLLENPKSLPKERVIQYLKAEFDVANLLELFEKWDFKNKKYFIQIIPKQKLDYLLKSAWKFNRILFQKEFGEFLLKLTNDNNPKSQAEIFSKLENLMSSNEAMISILLDVFYGKEEEFVQFYQKCSKIDRIELLERIFSDFSNTMERPIWQYQARVALEEMKKRGKITLTEQLFLDCANQLL